MSKININPYDTLTGLDGLPLDLGYIYFGQPNLDPRTNPLTVYWDAALTQPVNQPIRTANGRVWNAGSIALIYTASNYSVQVLDKNQAQVLFNLNVALPVDNPVPINQGGTGATTAAGALANLGVISAIVQQTYAAYTTGGVAAAFTLTPAPALVASPARTRFNITFHVAGAAAPTLSVSGLAPKLLKQYDATGAKVAAVIKINQISDVIDDGVDYVLIDPLPAAVGAAAGVSLVRQTVLNGVKSALGDPSFLTAGAALNYNIAATAVPLLLTYGNGFAAQGAADLVTQIGADAANQGALAPNATNFLTAAYVSSTAVTWGSTLAPYQFSKAYDRTVQSMLNFGGAPGTTVFPDDMGNTWAPQAGAKVQATQFKFGTGALGGAGALNALNGTTDFLKSTSFVSIDRFGSWAMRCWVYPTVLPGAGTTACIMAHINAGGFGILLFINNNAGTVRFAYALSTSGAAADIAAFPTLGTSAVVANVWRYVELTYDALATTYRLKVDGIQEQTTVSALRICAFTQSFVGGLNAFTLASVTGYIDKAEPLVPYCDHPGATAYAPPAAAPAVTTAGYCPDWYDVGAAMMKTISAASVAAGTDPTFTPVSRMYVGEADTNGAGVTAVRAYAYRGEYTQPWVNSLPLAGVPASVNHNIGVYPEFHAVEVMNLGPEAGFTPGQVTDLLSDNGSSTYPIARMRTPVSAVFTPGTNRDVGNPLTGAVVSLSTALWAYRQVLRRNKGA